MSSAQIISLLRVNGVSTTESDAVIEEVLAAAHYTNEEIASALVEIRNPEVVKEEDVTSGALRKIIRSDQTLAPAEVHALLGIDVSVELPDNMAERVSRSRKQSRQIIVSVAMTMLVLGALFVAAVMAHDIDVFSSSIVSARVYEE